MSKRRAIEGDTLPNALAALARTRERTLAEIDENLAARDAPDDGHGKGPGASSQESEDDRVAFR